MPKFRTLGPLKVSRDEIAAPGATVTLTREDAAPLLRLNLLAPLDDQEDDGDLPEDFPGRPALIKAGLTTVEAVAALTAEQLGELKGIGKATVEQIATALAALEG